MTETENYNAENETTQYVDETLVCKDCGKEFVFTAGEQAFYAEKRLHEQAQGLQSLP